MDGHLKLGNEDARWLWAGLDGHFVELVRSMGVQWCSKQLNVHWTWYHLKLFFPQSDTSWWKGTSKGRTGLIPSNYGKHGCGCTLVCSVHFQSSGSWGLSACSSGWEINGVIVSLGHFLLRESPVDKMVMESRSAWALTHWLKEVHCSILERTQGFQGNTHFTSFNS